MTNQEIRFASGLYEGGNLAAFNTYLVSKGATLQNFLYRMNQVNELDRTIARRAQNRANAISKAKAETAKQRAKAGAVKAQAAIIRAENVSPMNRIVKPILAIGAIIVAVVFIKKKTKKKVTRKRRK